MKRFFHYFAITARCLFVEYGDPSLPSHCIWFVPGTYDE